MGNVLYDGLFAPHLGRNTPFLVSPTGHSVTYDAFLKLAAGFAHTLVAQGVRPGDRVALQIAKSPEALALYAACVQCGAIYLPLNVAYTPTELAYFVEDAAPHLILCDDASYDDLRPIAAVAGARLLTLNADRLPMLHPVPRKLSPRSRVTALILPLSSTPQAPQAARRARC